MLVLASTSPRRQELLRAAGIPFVVDPPHIPEFRLDGEPSEDYARRLAAEKARNVFRRRSSDVVLGADTIVLVEHELLGKPREAQDAAYMLRLLSGRSHQVMTAVCLVGPGREHEKFVTGWEDLRVETTQVTMTTISEDEIRDYVASGEPLDKAGAYAIQGRASRWVTRVEGCYFNVVGLPVPLVYRMLKERKVF